MTDTRKAAPTPFGLFWKKIEAGKRWICCDIDGTMLGGVRWNFNGWDGWIFTGKRWPDQEKSVGRHSKRLFWPQRGAVTQAICFPRKDPNG